MIYKGRGRSLAPKYVAELTGLDPRWTFTRRFIRRGKGGRMASAEAWADGDPQSGTAHGGATVLAPGLYEYRNRMVLGVDSSVYVRVTKSGEQRTVEVLSKAQAVEILQHGAGTAWTTPEAAPDEPAAPAAPEVIRPLSSCPIERALCMFDAAVGGIGIVIGALRA